MEKQGSLVMAMIWMAVLSLLLFWLPVLGPLIAGWVGGYTAASASRGLLAALIPVIILCLMLFVFATGIGLPLVGVLAGLVLFIFLVVQGALLLIGALIGGLMA